MKKRISIWSFLLTLSFTLPVYSQNYLTPDISINEAYGLRAFGKKDSTINLDENFYFYTHWGRWLSKNKNYIKEGDIPQKEEYISEEIFNTNYYGVKSKRLYLNYFYYTSPKAIYFFQNGTEKILGYCLMENTPLEKLITLNDPIILQIKSFPVSNYLQGKIKLPQNTTIKFYEKEKNNFIERYGIVKTPNFEVLVLDSFYPKELETNLESYVLNTMNEYVNMIYLRDLYEHDKLPSGIDLIKEAKKYEDKKF